MKATVVNCLKEPFDIYIGRWNPKFPINSKWANPFRIGRDGNRKEVIRKYEEYINNKPELLKSIDELRGKRLGCYCAPQACHGDYLANLVNEWYEY